MPHNESLEPKNHSYKIRLGQIPLTIFKDYRSSIDVELIKWDNVDTVLDGTYQFVKATWSDSPKENEGKDTYEKMKALKAMLSGKALGLGLETINFIFKISGITRIDTHQIVRQRIGVTFSQQCTGDRFLTHDNVLVEECISANLELLSHYIRTSLTAKRTYCELVNSGISIQSAREILPQNLETFIFMSTNLATLLFFHQKRIENESQTWSMNVITQKMADEVCEIYPEMKEVFEKNKSRFKFQKEASADRKNQFATNLYLPEEDSFEYHERDFLYDKTKKQMHFTDTPITPRCFWGMKEITKEDYNLIKKEYSKAESESELLHLTNTEIEIKIKKINIDLHERIQPVI